MQIKDHNLKINIVPRTHNQTKKQERKFSPLSFILLKSQNKTLHTHTHQEQIEEHNSNKKFPKVREHKLHKTSINIQFNS